MAIPIITMNPAKIVSNFNSSFKKIYEEMREKIGIIYTKKESFETSNFSIAEYHRI